MKGSNLTFAYQPLTSCSGVQELCWLPLTDLSDYTFCAAFFAMWHMTTRRVCHCLPVPCRLWPQCVYWLSPLNYYSLILQSVVIWSILYVINHLYFFGTPRYRFAVELMKYNFRVPHLHGPLTRSQEET